MISPLLLPSNTPTTDHTPDEFNIDQTPLPLPPPLDLALFNERLEVRSSSITFPNLVTEHDSEESGETENECTPTSFLQTSHKRKRRSKKNTSWVWKWFDKNQKEGIGKCKVAACNVTFSLSTATSSYAYHLSRIHLITKNTSPRQNQTRQQTIEESIATTKPLPTDKQELANFRLL